MREFWLRVLAWTFLTATGWFPILVGIANLVRYIPMGKRFCTEPVTARIIDTGKFAGIYHCRIHYDWNGVYYERTCRSRQPLGAYGDDLTIYVNPRFPKEISLYMVLSIDMGRASRRSDIGISIGLILFGMLIVWAVVTTFTE